LRNRHLCPAASLETELAPEEYFSNGLGSGQPPPQQFADRFVKGAYIRREVEGIFGSKEFAYRTFGVIHAIVELLSVTIYIVQDRFPRILDLLGPDISFLDSPFN
jgi:hypothetical protein